MKKKIAIIGAGISGLTAGCYSLANGYDAEIFEMHDLPGGLCTAWKRKGYTFDGCIHWLTGINPASPFHSSWRDIGALDNRNFMSYDIIWQIEGDSGKKLILYSDIDKLEKHMLELSPEDSEPIGELADAVRRFPLAGKPGSSGPAEKYRGIMMGEYIGQFKDPFLREALTVYVPEGYSVFALIWQLAVYNNRDAFWPEGGSLEFAKGIEKRFLELGGRIRYASRVVEVVADSGRAAAVKLEDGSVCEVDFVVSAIDSYSAIFKLLKGKYVDDDILALYNGAQTSGTSIQISLGIECDLSDQPHCINIRFGDAGGIEGLKDPRILIKNYCYDRTMCPPGKSVITSLIQADYEYWEKLHKSPEAYKMQKKALADRFVKLVEERFPAARGKIEATDVATPMTYNRYTDVWRGAYCGWKGIPENAVFKIPSTLPGLKGFYLAGQWSYPSGGLPVALISGKTSVMRICREDGKEFASAIQMR